MASTLTRPDEITIPFADSGTKTAITNTSSATVPSFPDGWPAVFSNPLGSGGLAPTRAYENGIINMLTQHLRFINAGGKPVFDSSLSTAIGGYPVGVILQDNAGENEYINILDGNTTNFNTTPASIGVSWMLYNSLDKWESLPVGYCQPFIEAVMGTDATTWLTTHPNWALLKVEDVNSKDRAMVVAGDVYNANDTFGSANAITVSHTHTITDAGHSHTDVPLKIVDVDRGLGQSSLFSVDDVGDTSTETTGITINSAGSSGTNANYQPSIAYDWIIKVA